MTSEEIRRQLQELLINFEHELSSGDLRRKVLALVPCFHHLRDLGKSLISLEQDRDAAHRWNLANEIRRENISVRDKLIKYFVKNVGQKITGEELKYLAKDRSEWARRVRELRTEFGWPVVTRNTGRPNLEVGVYLLEADRQSPEHDRHIPDPVKRKVLWRDDYKCQECGWTHDDWNRSDPRHLELHHMKPHAKGGENTEENLITVCTICHDDIHKGEIY